ncbi:MAG: hypothetical protein NTU63_02750 [Candidatus Pacearchaeota archaeon]|nr:hypothetical protein [Candidatus Pacearchaeota archaeon]
MVNKKEIAVIALIIILISVSSALLEDWKNLLYVFSSISIIVILNVAAKKFMAFQLDSEIEMKIWGIRRYGFKLGQHFKKAFPAGAFFPVLSKLIFFPFKNFVWMASLVFDIKPRIYKAAKRYGLYTFSEITEYHLGLIAMAGIVINLVSAIIGYFIGFPMFARLNIYYAFFNMLPISDLDGNKIFFGSLAMWGFLASLVLIGMLFAIFII